MGYIGTHGMAHSLDTIVKAAKIIQDKNHNESIHFLFIGSGSEKRNLLGNQQF